MKLNNLILIADAIERISEWSDTDVNTIIDCLEGHCFSEEDAGEIREYHRNQE